MPLAARNSRLKLEPPSAQAGIGTTAPNFGLSPSFAVDTVAKVAGGYLATQPSCRVTDDNGGTVISTSRAVFLSLIPVDPSPNPSAKLELVATPQTCCVQPLCADIHMACCDCNNPECLKCAVPDNGLVSWAGARVIAAGTFAFGYTLHETLGPRKTHFFNDSAAERRFTILAVRIPLPS